MLLIMPQFIFYIRKLSIKFILFGTLGLIEIPISHNVID